MNFFIYTIFLIALSDSMQRETKQPCRKGNHSFSVLPHPKPNNAKLKGLDKYTYTFYLISSYEIINDYQIAFSASFPVNINFSLYEKSVYLFNPDVFCLNFLIKEKIKVLKGSLSHFHSKEIVISEIWITIDQMLLNKPIERDMPNMNTYYIMNNVYVKNMPNEIVLLKKMMNQKESFYQLVTAVIDVVHKKEDDKSNSNEKENNEEYLKVGTETIIQDIDGSKAVGMTNGKEYLSVMKLEIEFKYFKYVNVNNLICLDNEKSDRKCAFV